MSDNLSENQYDQIISHGLPTVTLNPRTWFRWDVIGAVILRPFRRKRTAPPQARAMPDVPLIVRHPALPEPTPPMERVTVPAMPAGCYDILVEAVSVLRQSWPDDLADVEAMCMLSLPLMGNPFGVWRDVDWHDRAVAAVRDGYGRASAGMRRTVATLQRHPDYAHLQVTVLAPNTNTWVQCADQCDTKQLHLPFHAIISSALDITLPPCDVQILTSPQTRDGGSWEFVLWADDDRYEYEAA